MPYKWKSENREGISVKKPNYAVVFEWRYPEIHLDYTRYIEMVYATDAERAINKTRRKVQKEFDCERRDLVIIEVTYMEEN